MKRGGGFFRPDRGWQGWPQALIYTGLYALCLGLSLWNLLRFDLVIFWLANGVLLAACLQLPRRYSLLLLVLCPSLNLVSSLAVLGSHSAYWFEPLLNLAQVLVALVLTRRLCGACPDMRHPMRILAFALGAAFPAVFLTTGFTVGIMAWSGGHDWQTQLFLWRHLFLMEYLGLVILTPCLLLWSQGRGEATPRGQRLEGLGLLAFLSLVVVWCFTRSQPALFVIIIPVIIMAYRLSPPWVGVGLILLSLISGVLTLYGYGPISQVDFTSVPALSWAADLMHQVPYYYGLLLVMTAVALPISALTSDRRRMSQRMGRHARRAREQTVLARQAVEAKARFSALISHEMRTPLYSVQSYTDVLCRRQDLPPDAQYQLQAVARSGEALMVLIEDLLEATKGDDAVSLQPCNLDEVVRQTVAQDSALAVAKGLGIRLDLQALEGVIALCDGRRIRAALHQIMSNAVKFSDKGQICLSARLDEDGLVLRVEDQGPGISASFKPRLFDLFAQDDDSTHRQHPGAGIGLPAARRHARVMGGDVDLVHTSEKGSVFELRVRVEIQTVALKAAENHIQTRPEPSPRGLSRHILVVDDHDLNRSVLRHMIRGAGYQVEVAANGQAALDHLARSEFDLVLMDLRMPGMDGFEVSRQIRLVRGARPGPEIVAVTADSHQDLTERLHKAGIVHLLTKPFSQDRLLACLAEVLVKPDPPETPTDEARGPAGVSKPH